MTITINFSDVNELKNLVSLISSNKNVEDIVKSLSENQQEKKHRGRPRKIQLEETSVTKMPASTFVSRTKGYKKQNHFQKTYVKLYQDKDEAKKAALDRKLSLTTIYKVRLPEYKEESKHLPVMYAIVPKMDKAMRLSVRAAYNEAYKNHYGETLKCAGNISSKRVFKKIKAKQY